MRNMPVICGLLVALILPVGRADAFEQTAPAPVPEASAPPAKALESAGSAPALAPDLDAGKKDRGLKIPGLGSFNVLPKMDFGLELLYGEPPKADTASDPLRDDDVTIRGSVKRRF